MADLRVQLDNGIVSFPDTPEGHATFQSLLADREQAKVPETTTTPTTVSPGQALTRTLQSTGESAVNAGMDYLHQGLLPHSVGAVGDLARAVYPVVAPEMAAAGVLGPTVRAATQPTTMPEVDAAQQRDAMLVGGAQLLRVLPNIARVLMRTTAPSIRTIEAGEAARAAGQTEAAGAATENLGTALSNIGRLASQAPVGTAARQATEGVSNRLLTESGQATRQAESYQRNYNPETIRQYRTLQRAPAQEVDPATNRLLPPQNAQGRITAPVPPLTEGDYSTVLLDLRHQAGQRAQAAIDFDRNVTQALRGVGPAATVSQIARSPDLYAALTQHATPAEAAIFHHALELGQPLAALPYSERDLAILAKGIQSHQGVLGTLGREIGLDTLLATVGFHTHGVLGLAGAAAVRAALKGVDYALSSGAFQAAVYRPLGRIGAANPWTVVGQTLTGLSGRPEPATGRPALPAGAY